VTLHWWRILDVDLNGWIACPLVGVVLRWYYALSGDNKH